MNALSVGILSYLFIPLGGRTQQFAVEMSE